MIASNIDYKDTGSFSKILLDYIERDSKLASFITDWPTLPAFERQIAAKKSHYTPLQRTQLTEVLHTQYGELSNGVVAAQIQLLSKENTFTVTTGHQLNLFTGPLYFLFKIASTIKLTRQLKSTYPTFDFVPVFWMATEDHDFAEINHTYLHGEKISWNRPAGPAAGRISTEGIEAAVQKYLAGLGLSGYAKELGDMVRSAYLAGDSLSNATRRFVHELFGEEGLVIIDADHPVLKQQFAPIIEADILHQHSFHSIERANKELEAHGYPVQVNGREINFFYLSEESRERIVYQDGKYRVLHGEKVWTADQLKEEIQQSPLNFSPNVVMRPVYQEVVLPNLAYIGGAAEVAYWLQLKGVFDQYQIPYPLIIPRNSAIITDSTVLDKMTRLGLNLAQLFQATEQIQKQYVASHTAHTLHLEEEWEAFQKIFDQIKSRSVAIDPTLGPSTAAVEARLRRALQNLEKKLLKADLRNHQDAVQQIERLKEKLFPGGSLQERKENFGLFYVKHGNQLIKELIEQFDPLAFKFTILH
jgi:bacillithiol biosynthesis cysteine-adding enzyme BshC